MLQFNTTIHILAKYLPDAYMALINEGEAHPLEAEDEVPDLEVLVTFEPGVFYPGYLGGLPEDCEEDSADPPEIDKVEIMGDGFFDITSSIPNHIFEQIINRCWSHQDQVKIDQSYEEAEARLSFMDEDY